MPRVTGLLERIQQPLYDTLTITPEKNHYQFFEVPLGSCPKNSESPKTLTDTNMDQGSCLPYPKTFEIHAIGLHYDKTVNEYDLEAFKEHSRFQLFIGTKVYLDLPLAVLEDISKAKNSGTYLFAEPIELICQQNFRASITYDGPKKFDISFRVRCVMQGFFVRTVH